MKHYRAEVEEKETQPPKLRRDWVSLACNAGRLWQRSSSGRRNGRVEAHDQSRALPDLNNIAAVEKLFGRFDGRRIIAMLNN